MSRNLTNRNASIRIDSNTKLQSKDLYIQAAGSVGKDSTRGVHLRWALKNNLANHLPKGDYYTGAPMGLNKSNDYIKVFKAPYVPIDKSISLAKKPKLVLHNEAIWIYTIDGKKIFVYFRNKIQYKNVLNNIDPSRDREGFLQMYGNNLIEIESPDYLFFGVKINGSSHHGTIKTEIQSVEANEPLLPKKVAFRKQIRSEEFNNIISVENGRTVRLLPLDCIITEIIFHFYSDFIEDSNIKNSWTEVGDFALTLNDDEVIDRLDPQPTKNPVHARWPRYNQGEYVNIENYIVKWNRLPNQEEHIKDSVNRYLILSEDINNPLANERYTFDNSSNPQMDQGFVMSYLMMLQMAALDFHVARMLGLGTLDLSGDVEKLSYIYMVEYYSYNGSEFIQHLYMTLPTGLSDERPSLPVVLKEPVPGIQYPNAQIQSAESITDANGYAHGGQVRYISLLTEELIPNEPFNTSFYSSSYEFDMSKFTYPVFVGIEYKLTSDLQWQEPELCFDNRFHNVNSQGRPSQYETIHIPIPQIGQAAYIHRETRSDMHTYGSYGINWFSRATSSDITWKVTTYIQPQNPLLPPSCINALLIQEESPLMFTTQSEQVMLNAISNSDKTLVRLIFEYDASQDMISYHKSINGLQIPEFDINHNSQDIFAQEIEIFFSPEVPEPIFGTIGNVIDSPMDNNIAIVETQPLSFHSSGETIYPEILQSEISHYIGSALNIEGKEFIIADIIIPVNTPRQPKFYLYKIKDENNDTQTIGPSSGQTFMFTKNMLNTASWGQQNPLPLKVAIGDNWAIHEEEVSISSGAVDDVTENTFYRKFRGITKHNTIIEQFLEHTTASFAGIYKITFPNFTLGAHPQFNPQVGSMSVEWYRGSIRLPYEHNANGERKTLKVIKFEQSANDLVVYAQDELYESEPLQSSAIRQGVWANFYPGYKVYIYHNAAHRLTEEHTLPQDENLEKYSIFGLRSRVTSSNFYISSMSLPTVMFARKIEAPQTPAQPKGALFATRPDYFGRSTYSFTTEYTHKPFSISVLRTNADIILSALYIQTPYGQEPINESVEDISSKNDDEFANDRLSDLVNLSLDVNGLFPSYNDYGFPIPNSPALFASINQFIIEHNQYYNDTYPNISPSTIQSINHVIIPPRTGVHGEITFLDFVRECIQNTYVPLTKTPIIYQHIKGEDYMPQNKPQNIMDRNGVFLNPNDAEFDMAPMMKVVSTNPHKTLFTDFTLDGASSTVYFYAVQEINSQMNRSPLSKAIGPVRLVNTFAVKTPDIKMVKPVSYANFIQNNLYVEIQINAYSSIQNIAQVNLYRALNMGDATALGSMKLVKTISVEEASRNEEGFWSIQDDFNDLEEIPFGEPLYYRVTVDRKIQYAKANALYNDNNPNNLFDIVDDFAPSQPSKLIITSISENNMPTSPELLYIATEVVPNLLSNTVLSWEKQTYKGEYYVYKMNDKGLWKQIGHIISNNNIIEFPLINSDLDTDELLIQDEHGNSIYHHFKVLTKNSAGVMSIEEKILTIPQA